MNERLLPITSAYNMRDLGGFEGFGGKRIKKLRIVRSGDFSTLNEEDSKFLSSIPIRTVIDFRSEEEYRRRPDRIIESVTDYLHLSIDSGNLVPQFYTLARNVNLTDAEKMEKGHALMATMYKEMVFGHASIFCRLFEVLQNAEKIPVLFHCSAGKDRTGVATALILFSLGVSEEDIYTDYLDTNKYMGDKYAGLKSLGIVSTFFSSVRKEYLESAIKLIKNNYGSVEKYLQTVLSVDLSRMRTLYLE